MLTTIEIIKKDGGVLTLPIYDPTNFAVMDVQGLDPVKANIVTSNFSQMDGVQYHASRREMRNIIFKIRIISIPGGPDIQELRKQLYGYLLPKSDIKMRFIQNGVTSVLISGQVESFDAPIFVKEPEVTISVLCFDPDFYSETEFTLNGLSIGTTQTTNTPLVYNGDVDSGFLFTITGNGPTSTCIIDITDVTGAVKSMTLSDSTGLLLAGDIIKLSTIPGNKYLTRMRSGTETSILWALSRSSDWLKLYPGTNLIRVKTAFPTAQTPYSFKYTNKIGGL